MSVIKTNSELNLKFKQKVLIAVDYDHTSQKVAEAGYMMAKSMNAEVYLLHVLAGSSYYLTNQPSPIMGYVGFSTEDFMQQINTEGLPKGAQYFLDTLVKHLGDPLINTLVKEGNVSAEVLETVETLDIDIIVMGSHSKKWLEKVLIGSVTEDVLNKTIVPLFIVPTKEVEEEH